MAVSGFMIHAGLGDEPDARSNHTRKTATAGGVGIVAGVGGFFLLLPMLWALSIVPIQLPMALVVLAQSALMCCFHAANHYPPTFDMKGHAD